MRNLLTLLFFVIFVNTGAWAQSVVGMWKTIDDETGKPKSIIEIYEKGGKYYGKISQLIDRTDEPICTQCTDDRKNKKLKGLEIIRGMQKDGEEYNGGTILDPKNGTVYDCKFWIDPKDPDKLLVRGYVAFFYRTQNWSRVN